MGKISGKVSKGLGAAIKEAQEKMTGNVITNINDENDIENISQTEDLLNSGATAHKKRKRRTKAEMEAARAAEAAEDNSLFESLNVSAQKEEEKRPKNHEEFCEMELQKAKERGYERPEFDYRDFYEKGQVIWYVRILGGLIQSKELMKLKIRTIYPRTLIATEEKGACQCIGYNERDLVFLTPKEADDFYKTINLKDEEAEISPKSKRNGDEGISEGLDDEDGDYEPSVSLEEAMSDD